MITESQRIKIFKKIEEKLGQKITKNLILSSRYGIKRFSNRRVYLIETTTEKYILEVTKSEINIGSLEIFNDRLKEYYPEIIFHKKIKVGEMFNVVVCKYIQGEKIASILNSNRASFQDKSDLINSISSYLLQKNKVLGKKSSKKFLDAEIKQLVDIFAEKFL